MLVGGAQTPMIQQAMRDPAIKLMSLARVDAYPRRFTYLSKVTLPAGTIDLGTIIPDRDVQMIGTKAMLVARSGLHPALINLLTDAAREIHSDQGYFEAAGEFPSTDRSICAFRRMPTSTGASVQFAVSLPAVLGRHRGRAR